MSGERTVYLTEKVTLVFLMDFVRAANNLSSYVLVEKEGTKLNAKSLLSMSALKGYSGKISIIASGVDSKEALEILRNHCSTAHRRSV
ncbi:HPr family phosphocarrier protein [Guptibacillus algicola]|uniref:HPr family phosphocarrier protein n=1 Tax=Guptibacillus algicola TaxID=225844 RepID=UPI001CD6B2B1|nr:HPr family phosphocarrier protein [Alkalihalobacillus algicola]MCA0985925.1 HPr family phosphocarrier protein [Alkalihalobacillus algicola]